jgi:hypothetical protein
MNQARLDYSDSIRRIRQLGLGFLDPDKEPPMPDHVPQPEDEEPLGVSFYRTFVGEDADLSNLTIPKTFLRSLGDQQCIVPQHGFVGIEPALE